jgi:hypothetical protein
MYRDDLHLQHAVRSRSSGQESRLGQLQMPYARRAYTHARARQKSMRDSQIRTYSEGDSTQRTQGPRSEGDSAQRHAGGLALSHCHTSYLFFSTHLLWADRITMVAGSPIPSLLLPLCLDPNPKP